MLKVLIRKLLEIQAMQKDIILLHRIAHRMQKDIRRPQLHRQPMPKASSQKQTDPERMPKAELFLTQHRIKAEQQAAQVHMLKDIRHLHLDVGHMQAANKQVQ